MEEKNNRDMNLFDLIALCCRAIGRFFCYIGRALGEMIRLSYRRWYIVLPVMLVVLCLALYWARPANRMYRAGTMVHLNGVKVSDVKQQYDELIKATPAAISQRQSFAQLLQIDDSLALGLSHFKYFNVIDCRKDSVPDIVDFRNKHDIADTVDIVMNDYLYLQFRTKDPDSIAVIGSAVIAFLNSNAHMQQSFADYRAVLQQHALFCQQQIGMLDSVSRNFYFQQTPDKQYIYQGGSSILIGRRELRMLHPQVLSLLEDNMKTAQLLGAAKAPVVPVSEFSIEPRAVNGSIKCSLIGIIIGYLLGCILALLIDQRKAINAWLKKE